MKLIKSKKKITAIAGLISMLLLGISTLLLTLVILKFGPIEPVIRFIIIGFLIIIMVGFSLGLLNLLNKRKQLPKIVLIVVIVLLSIGEFYGNYILTRAFDSINTINKETTIYSSILLTLKETKYDLKNLENKKIAIINNRESVDGYKISMDILKENKLDSKVKLVEYADYGSMIKDLYNKDVDAIFIPNNTYNSFANSTNDENNPYKDLTSKTVILAKKDKEVIKETKNNVAFAIDKPFTVLLMGVDTISNDIKNSAANGDALMLVTFNPKTLNATILSIPRDTYVPISCLNNKENKITHAGWYGEECMEKTIENFTGIDIGYYVKVDFKAVVDLVDILGGVELDIPYSFCEQNSRREWGKNTVYVRKGLQTINGEQALAFSRNRHPNPGLCSSEWTNYNSNDFVRGQNQQAVIGAILNKLKGIRDVETFLKILESVKSHLDTNFTTDQIMSFYNVGMAVLQASSQNSNPINMQRLYLNGYDRYIYEQSMGFALYNYIYYTGSLDDISNAMKINLGLINPPAVNEFSFSINEEYKPVVIGKNNTTTTKYVDVLPNFVGKNKSDVLSWSTKTGIAVNFKTIPSTSSEHTNGMVMAQDFPSNYKLSDIPKTGVTFTIVDKTAPPDNNENKPQDDEEIDCAKEENKELDICRVTN